MENITLSSQHVGLGKDMVEGARHDPAREDGSLAEEMKQIRRAKLRRLANADPSLMGRLVALEASPVYNASGDLIQTVGADFGSV